MNNMLTLLSVTITSGFLLLAPQVANADEKGAQAKQPIAYALSKKVNKEVKICMEKDSTHSLEFENHKHLRMMMPDTYEKCDKGVKSACDVKKSVLIAMELTHNKG
jgi:hypothetical protein